MPQDPHLYGQPPPKKQKKEMALSGSLAFTSQLSSLLASSSAGMPSGASSSTTTGRARPSKSKTTDLASVKVKRSSKDGATNTNTDVVMDGKKLNLKSPLGTEESKAELEFARRKMESKARLYAAMQRGDYVGREIGLVDFDRKWAESQSQNNLDKPQSSSDSDSDSDTNVDTALIEYTDEFGRLRRGTRAEKMRMERRLARGAASAAELDRMSARPKAPETLIYGDAVQVEAFAARNGLEAMEELARKRDRSPTPPETVHYQADREIRTKGVGFYKFSKEEAKREEEMKALEEERARTEASRKEREENMARRKKEIEERRKEIGERRAKKMAESFLDGLGRDLVTNSKGGSDDGDDGDGKRKAI
ncbi:Coiled-coil domain-containing protein 174 [Madurella fahalii]|uniref:Coiled-coil domain-containing protein 174 n=1 Tax=Madurella fahalii TaxID=1157608 RepID=A0ABQ0GDF6_9PEZI